MNTLAIQKVLRNAGFSQARKTYFGNHYSIRHGFYVHKVIDEFRVEDRDNVNDLQAMVRALEDAGYVVRTEENCAYVIRKDN